MVQPRRTSSNMRLRPDPPKGRTETSFHLGGKDEAGVSQVSAGERRKRCAVHRSVEELHGSDTSDIKLRRPGMSWSVLSHVSKSNEKERKAAKPKNGKTKAPKHLHLQLRHLQNPRKDR